MARNLTEPIAEGENTSNKIQKVQLAFSDGTVAIFSGPAVVWPKDEKKKTITSIHFYEPVDLPENCNWEFLS